MDGASTDNTLDLIKQNCSKVSKIISEPDKGIYDALNKGINAATGDIVGFLHSDDLFADSTVVSDIVNTMNEHGSDAVHADLQYVKKCNTSEVVRLWTSGEYTRDKLKVGWMPAHPTFYMRRSVYEEKGGFDLSFSIAADYDSLLRYLNQERFKLAYLKRVIVKMRVGGASNRSLKNIIKKTSEDINALKKNNISWPKALFIKNFSKISQFIKK
ncbi:hypothetical protein N473_05595 [Pseudoalteromonas luteoviolacea CPMOR-1]|uniref:Glycosyltransferase 2-like domain-containing protein n=1 Tax=Pseudoalteromonas luteoviolacea CPMOR-1 TaxID=1365248 RepID=A0A167HK04_9GAMM|nr:hypothetical protein N473_05595 [Pseudoalteromonas luteoviolacea CPMOR-1]